MAAVNHPEILSGRFVRLREVTVEDAAFILELRLSGAAKFYLHETENDLGKQEAYIRRYLTLPDEWYFIIESPAGERLGCVGVLDVRDDGAEIGRWIMRPSKDFRPAVEANLITRRFVFEELGLGVVRAYTRQDNAGQIAMFKLWGYDFVGERDGYVYCNLTRETYLKNYARIARFVK